MTDVKPAPRKPRARKAATTKTAMHKAETRLAKVRRKVRAAALPPFRLLSPFRGSTVRKGQAVDLFVIPEHRLAEYLAGRPRDPRVKYCTHINRSKQYRAAA